MESYKKRALQKVSPIVRMVALPSERVLPSLAIKMGEQLSCFVKKFFLPAFSFKILRKNIGFQLMLLLH
jgi:hypothetical protein